MDNGDNRDTGPLSIDQYLDQLPEAPEEEGQAEAEEEQDAGEESADVEEDAAEEAEEDETEDQDEPDAEDDAPEAYPIDEYGEITVELKDGTRTTLSELANGNLRQSDYSRKTAEVAEQRKQLESRAQELSALEQRLNEMAASLEEQEPDWAQLAQDDPFDWQLKKIEWDKKQAQKAETRRKAEQQRAQQVEQFKAATIQAAIKAVPEWQEPGRFDAMADARKATALAAGFTEQEYEQAVDFRLAALLEWAAKGREKSAKVAATQKKLSKVPKVMKPGASTGSRAERDAAEKAAKAKRFKSAMSIEEYLNAKG